MKKSKPSAIIILAFFCNSYCNAQSHASADALYDAITGAISGTIQVSGNYNMDELTGNRLLPMIVHSGVDVQGDYDLLSEPNSSFATTSPSGTLIYTTNRGTVSGTDVLSDSYVFVMEPGSAIKNIRIRGGMWSWFDYNLENALTTNKLSGGILIDNIGNNTSYAISNCEIFGFSYAGIFISKKTKAITIEKCYIHNIKGICEPGTGYGIWLQSEGFSDTNNFTDINSVIFGDLKGAIDGTAGPRSWNINDCTFSWFSKVVNKHNGNFKAYHPANSNVLCQGSAGPDCEFFDRPNNFTSISTDVPFRVNDLAGGSIAMTKNISHNGGLGSVPYPYYTESKTDINLPMPANLCTVNNLLASGGILNTIPCCSTGTTNYGWSGIPIGFNFFLNNQPVPITSCNISSNGFVEFNNPAGFGSIFNLIPSAPIPDPNVPNNIIYALWGNFKCDQNTKISYCLDGSGTNHEFIVYWENLKPASYVGVNPDHIFYLKLHETTNEIEIGIFRAEIKPAVIGWEDIFGTTAHIIFNYNNDPDPDKGVYKTHSVNPVIYHVLPPHNFNIEISGNSIQMEQGACNS